MADPAFTLWIILGVVLCGLLMLLVLHSSSRWHQASKSCARLPKGSFGWPIIGDTLALNQDPLNWAISQEKRYGNIFKASLYFRKSIVGTTPEFAKFVLQNSDLFELRFPKSVEFVANYDTEGPGHIAVRKLFTKTIGLSESLRAMFKTLEGIVFENLESWEQTGIVNGSEAAGKLVADTASYVMLGVKNVRSTPQGILAIENFLLMIEVMSSFLVNLPGTNYNKGLKARPILRSYIRDLLVKKRSQQHTDASFFQALVEAQKLKDAQAKGAAGVDFDDETIVDIAISAWVGAYKTTATTLTWTLKYLFDHPKIFGRVQAEQQQILEGKDLSVPGPRLAWEDMKKMVYTVKFFQELQRHASIATTVVRISTQDIVYQGLLIPKGWQVLPLFTSLHSNPANYPDPMCFNPDHFDAPPKPNSYMAFGSGSHRCPGEELAKVVTLIYIHYLTTTYKYEPVGPDLGTSRRFFPMINGGYPINVCRRI